MPLALAVLMSFAIAPLVELLRHLRLGHVPAVLLSLAMALVILSAVGAFVGSQFAGLAADLPRYQSNIGHKIQSIRGTAGRGTLARLNQTIENLAGQISGERDQQKAHDTDKDANSGLTEDARHAIGAAQHEEAGKGGHAGFDDFQRQQRISARAAHRKQHVRRLDRASSARRAHRNFHAREVERD